jgi:acetylornithine deacetylase/succinyl-diaminopimelate desuccinylase-like protein
MDTQGARPPGGAEIVRKLRGAWVEDGMLYGVGLANDKAQLAAEMIACRSIKKAGVRLQETLFVTGVAQECSGPVDAGDAVARWSGVGPKHAQVREGAGARWLVEHGVVADFALVGEVSNFCVTTAQAGYLRLRIAVPGLVVYTPFTRRGKTPAGSLNPYARAAHVIQALEEWAARYEKEHRFEFWGGVIEPRAQIYEVHGSGPIYTTPVDHCYIFLDIRLAPAASAAAIIGEVRGALAPVGIDCKIAAYDYRRGFVAEGAKPLLEALGKAHQAVLGTRLEYAASHQLSAWRDGNAFNEAGIPAIGYGPPTKMREMGTGTAGELRPIAVEDLVSTAKVFALTALSICGVEKAN